MACARGCTQRLIPTGCLFPMGCPCWHEQLAACSLSASFQRACCQLYSLATDTRPDSDKSKGSIAAGLRCADKSAVRAELLNAAMVLTRFVSRNKLQRQHAGGQHAERPEHRVRQGKRITGQCGGLLEGILLVKDWVGLLSRSAS